MWAKLLCAAAIGTAAATASAETVWAFSYTGFLSEDTNVFDPTLRYNGMFAGEDDDGNGEIDMTELTRFQWDNKSYVERGGWPCAPVQCELYNFTYDLKRGRLNFISEWNYMDEASSSASSTIAGSRLSFYGYTEGGGTISAKWLWTENTRFAIMAEVPEPSMALLLGVGLAGIGFATRRARKAGC